MFTTRIRPTLLFSTGEASGGDGNEGPAPEGAPETAADTSVEETGTTTEQPQIPEGYIPRTDYDKLEARQKEAQGWGTRLSQENATLREQAAVLEAWNSGDPAKQQWAADQLGIQLQEDDQLTDDGAGQQKYADVDPSVLQRLEAFEAYQTQQEQTQQQQQFHAAVQAEYDPLIKDMGVPDQLVEAVREAALNMNLVPSPQGDRLDIEAAWTGIKDFLSNGQHVPDIQKQMFENYRKTKRAPQVASGGSGTQVPSLDTSPDRVRYMLDRAAQQDG